MKMKRTHISSHYCLVILTFLSSYSAALELSPSLSNQRRSNETPHQHEPPARDALLKTILGGSSLTATPTAVVAGREAKQQQPPNSATNQSATATHTTEATTATTTTTTPSSSGARPPLDNTWIERILLQVEALDLNSGATAGHQKAATGAVGDQREKAQQHDSIVATDADDDAAEVDHEGEREPSAGSSQAPTDSDEDPLEATTLGSLTVSGGAPSATQYSVAGLTAGSPPLGSGASDADSLLDDEQRLVDSNNVSAVLTPSSRGEQQQQQLDSVLTVLGGSSVDSRPQQHQYLHPHHHQIAQGVGTKSGAATAAAQAPPPKPTVACDQAYTQCALRKVCAPALRAYNDDCQDLINNRTSQCSRKCLKAMIALRSSEEGDDLVNCDCQGNEYCQLSKQRGQACRPQVEEAVNPKTVVSCSTASWICLADQLCSTALEYYYRNCQSLFSQRHCSMHCNNSLSILYRQPKASKLVNCHCDGSEEFPCVKYKTYTERLCLNKIPQATIAAQMDADAAAADDDEQHQVPPTTAEDDGFNMTNDPETFILGSPSSSLGATGSNYNDEEEYEEDPKVADTDTGGGGGGEDSSSASSNGIQLVEDNWIPLMSGRYFTNLHQQQLRQQQQQQQRRSHQKQPNRQQQQQVLTQQQQQLQRKSSQKNVKQKTKSNATTNSGSYHVDGKRRYGRVLAFASTSSAAATGPSWQAGCFAAATTRLQVLLAPIWSAVVVVYLSPRIVFRN